MDSFSIERVVTILTPLFAAGASALTGWLSTKLGVHVGNNEVEGVMAAAFLGTVAIVFKWLHGRQIPSIAGLTLSPIQVDQIREQVSHHLAAVAPQAEIDLDQIAKRILERAAGPPSVASSPVTAETPLQ